MTTFADLAAARYVNLATFRKSGAKVATPVWAAAADNALYVFSAGNAGKIKRLRNSSQAEVACCTFNGKLESDWIAAAAEIVTEADDINLALQALRAKYGLQMWLADVGARLTGKFHRRAYVKISLTA